MSQGTFSSIALDVLDQYQQAGHHLVRACHGGIDHVVRGVQSTTATAGRVVDSVAQHAGDRIGRIAGTADRLEKRLEASRLAPLGAFPRTAAHASLHVAGTVSRLLQRLSDRIATGEAAEVVAAAAPKDKPRKTAGRKAVRRKARA